MVVCFFLIVGSYGITFAWTNKQVADCRIDIHFDRSFCSHTILNFWNKFECSMLVRHESVYNPLLLICESMKVYRPKLSLFKLMWVDHVAFLFDIEKFWVI